MRISRKGLIVAGLLVGLPLVAVAALFLLVDADQFRPLLQAQLQQRLRRPVSLGPVHLQLVPLSLRVTDLVVGQPAGFSVPQPFVQARDVHVGVAFWPLLRKQVSVQTVRLQSPRIELVRNPAGHWNYELPKENSSSQSGEGFSPSLDELSITDGQVAVLDQKQPAPREVYEQIDGTIKGWGPGRHGSLEGKVRLIARKATLQVRSDFENADALTAKGQLTLQPDAGREALQADYDVRRTAAPETWEIRSLAARVGQLQLTGSGTVRTQTTPAVLQLQVKTNQAPVAELTRLAALYGAQFPADLKVDGLVQADLQVQGTAEQPLLTGRIDATKAQISSRELAEPVRASELHIDLTPQTLTTRPFMLETGNTRLTTQAVVDHYSSPERRVKASLQTSDARLEELLRIASAYGVKPAGLTGSGGVSLDVRVTQAGKQFDYEGTGSLRGVTLSSPQLPRAVQVAAGDLKFSEDRVMLDHLQATMGSMHIDGNAIVRDFDHPHVEFGANIDQVNVAEVSQWSKAGASPANPGGGKLTAHGNLTVGKLVEDRVTLTNVKTTLNYARDVLTLEPFTANSFGGQQSGSIILTMRGPATSYAVRAKLANLDANQLLSTMTSLKGVLSGPLSGNADLRFVSQPGQDIARTLDGRLQLQMGRGRLAGVQILNELASLGKFLGYAQRQEGFTEVVRLGGSFTIQDGLATTNDLLMDLGGGTMTGNGTIGLADQSLKLRVLAVLSREFAQRSAGPIGGLLSTVLANQRGELVVPALVSGTFAHPRFTPDGEHLAKLKLNGMLPTANNPAALTSGIMDMVGAMTGKQPPSARPADSPANEILGIFDQFRRKKQPRQNP